MSTPRTGVDPDRFRALMGRFATGVTVVTAEHDGEVHGMTANAVTSVSLDPLLLLVCVGRRARMSRWLERSGGFAVNILTQDQEALSRYFAGTWNYAAPPEFRFVPWEGGPRLVAALAALGCRRERLIEAGDHWIVLGRVTALHEGDAAAQPLLFYGGRYHRLSPAEAVPAPDLWTGTDARIYYDEWSQEIR